MTLVAEKTYTPQELLSDPALAGYELVDGHLAERPMSERSSAISGQIVFLLRSEAKKSGEFVVYPSDLGYQCFPDSPNTVRFPDVSVVRSSRLSEIGKDPGYMPMPADLAVEVLSPNDLIRNIDVKVKQYLAAGFGLVWVVNPYWRHVHVYRPDGSVQLLSERDEITGETALPTFRCKVAEFFEV